MEQIILWLLHTENHVDAELGPGLTFRQPRVPHHPDVRVRAGRLGIARSRVSARRIKDAV